MVERKKKSTPQLGFFLEEETLKAKETVDLLGLKTQDIERIKSRKLWVEKPRGKAIFINEDWQGFIFNPDNFQETERVGAEKLSAVVMYLNDFSEEDSEKFSYAADLLKSNGAIFILEQRRGQEIDREERVYSLRKNDFAVPNILTGSKEYIFWEARLPKERKHRVHHTNLRQSKSEWVNRTLPKNEFKRTREYLNEGFVVVSTEEIDGIIANSTNALNDVRSVGYGFGVELESMCGCRWKVNRLGVKTHIIDCGESGCIGEPPKIDPDETFVDKKRSKKETKLITPMPFWEKLEQDCPICNEPILYRVPKLNGFFDFCLRDRAIPSSVYKYNNQIQQRDSFEEEFESVMRNLKLGD